VLTLEGFTSVEVLNRMCSCVLDYEQGWFVEVGPRAGRFMEAYDILKAIVKYAYDMIGCVNLI